MGKLLHKLVNGIVPSWFTKIRASDASPKKLLPFFRGAMSSSSPRSPTNTEMMALIDKDPNSYYSASEDEEEKEKEPPAKASIESRATAAPSPTKTATSIVKKDDTDDAHHGHHHLHLVVEQKPHNPSDHHHHLPRSKRKSQSLHEEDQEDHGSSIISRWPFKRHKGERRVMSSELPESLCEIVGNGSAVVKYSEDPHHAFWESMVEMIVGNGLWDMGNLEFLLYCYLSLNDPHLHDTIQRSFLQVLKDLERTS